MNTTAREAVARAFEEILGRKHPGLAFSVPDVRPQAKATAGTGEIVGTLTAPQDQRAVPDRNAPAAHEHDVEAGVQ